MPPFYTRHGDDGYTGLLGEGRVPKYHPQPEALGTIDEASAALGMARALSPSTDVRDVLRAVQQDLYQVMVELAATPETAGRFTTLGEDRLEWLEAQTEHFGELVELPGGFILPGDCVPAAALAQARTLVRRAERLTARLIHTGAAGRPGLLQYLNRLSSLCFVLELHANKTAGITSPSLARDPRP
jgi:cob(I)alamin adenosyltransferase